MIGSVLLAGYAGAGRLVSELSTGFALSTGNCVAEFVKGEIVGNIGAAY